MDVCDWCPFLTLRQRRRAPYSSLLRTNTLFVTPHLPYSPKFHTYPHTPDPDVYIWQFWRLPMIFCLWNALPKKNYWVVFPIISRCVHYLPLLLRSRAIFNMLAQSFLSRHFFFSKLLIEIWFKTPIVAFNRKMQWNYSFTSIESKAFILEVSNLLSHNKT